MPSKQRLQIATETTQVTAHILEPGAMAASMFVKRGIQDFFEFAGTAVEFAEQRYPSSDDSGGFEYGSYTGSIFPGGHDIDVYITSRYFNEVAQLQGSEALGVVTMDSGAMAVSVRPGLSGHLLRGVAFHETAHLFGLVSQDNPNHIETIGGPHCKATGCVMTEIATRAITTPCPHLCGCCKEDIHTNFSPGLERLRDLRVDAAAAIGK